MQRRAAMFRPPNPKHPQGREAQRVQTADEMVRWLPRLVGRFSYTGAVQYFQTLALGAQAQKEYSPDKTYAAGNCDETCQASIPNVKNARGKADCVAIGKGAGVQCVINVTWDQEWGGQGSTVEGGVSFLGPASILYGVDTSASVIRYLLLTTDALPKPKPAS